VLILPRWWQPSLAILVALLGAILTMMLVHASWNNALHEHEQVFTAQSEAVREQLLVRVKANDEMITNLATFVNSVTHVDADQFRLFSEELLRRHPYLLSASYLPRVDKNERLNFELSRLEAGFPGFVITNRSGDDYLPAPLRVQYFPLLFIEPFEPASVVMIGFDVLSEAPLEQAVQAAIDMAERSASRPYLIEEHAWGYWLFAAIYAGKYPPATLDERRLAVNGLVALRINGERMLAESLATRPLSAQLWMIPGGSAAPISLATTTSADEPAGRWAATVFTRSAEIGTGGQRFKLDLQRTVSWHDLNYLPVVAVLITGLLMTALLVLATRRAVRRTRQLEQKNIEIEQLVAEKTSELALEKERAQVTLASIGDAVITTDAAGRVEYLNTVAETLTGWTRAEARGRELAQVFQTRQAEFPESATGSKDIAVHGCLLVNRAQQEIAIDQSVAPISGRDGEMLGSVLVFRDVSQQRQHAREMTYQATHDALTGLYNRRAFEERLGQLLTRAKMDQSQHVLLYLDLDQFKIVNDACGHPAGDQLLRQLAAVLQNEVRQKDVLARLGGDELGILLTDCPETAGLGIANKILRSVSDFRFAWKERIFTISASIGLVPFGSESESAASILSAADAACYTAKDKGRNRVLVYQLDDIELNQRHSQMQWVTRLKHALEEDRFVLYSQPIVAIGHGTSSGLQHEVLLRLREDDGAIVPPGAFIPAAERYGMMPAIDRWVVRNTLQWLAAHRADPGLAESYGINLSGQSMSDAGFLEFVLQEIERSGVAPGRVSFEITETAAVAALDRATQFIQALKDKGCHFLLDDFGSGWSSFAYLKNLPVDFLKIDGSLVRDMDQDALDEAMVRAINEISHVLGIATIAEFVESEAILEKLKAMGVDYAQGYAISRPAPIDAHLGISPALRSQQTA
jgi:diguanylate cyclase (GGDEF)-like protein/PAS domain S-box-containing protein